MTTMVRYTSGEVRVIDDVRMLASDWLAESEQAAPLEDYNIDCSIEAWELDDVVIVRSEDDDAANQGENNKDDNNTCANLSRFGGYGEGWAKAR